jgi:hypothetical protein
MVPPLATWRTTTRGPFGRRTSASRTASHGWEVLIADATKVERLPQRVK